VAAWRWREGLLLATVFVFSVGFASGGLVLLAALGPRWTWHADRLRQSAPAEGPFSRIAIWRLVPIALGAAGIHHTGEPPR
jgi:hypothetical protein